MRQGLSLWLVLCLLMWSGASWSASVVMAVGSAPEQRFGPALDVFVDGSGGLSLQDVAEGPDRFQVAPPAKYFGIHKGRLWIRLKLTNASRETVNRWLVVGKCLQESVDLYEVRGDGTVRRYRNGTRVPVDARDVPTRDVVFPLEVQSGASTTLYLAISGRAVTAFQLGLWSPGHYLHQAQGEAALKYLATGTNALLIVTAILAAHARRRWTLALGGIGYFLLCVYSMVRDSYGVGVLPAGDSLWQQHAMHVLLAGAEVCLILFARTFLGIELSSPRLSRWLGVGAMAMSAVTILSAFAFLPWLSLGATLVVWVLLTGLTVLHVKDVRGWAFLAWWGVLWAGLLVTVGKGLGWLPMGFLPGMLPTLAGALIATGTLSYGLYRDVVGIQRGAAEARQNLIAQQRSESIRLRRAVRRKTRELRAALLVAKKASNERAEFLSMMAHELRAPLHVILGHGQILRRDLEGRTASRLEVIERNARKLYQLIEHALNYSRGTSDAVELEPIPVDLALMLRHLMEEAQFGSGQNRNACSLQVHGVLPARVMVDEQRLLQVLLNLLANAYKYGGSGQVSLRVDVLGQPTVLSVEGKGRIVLHHLRFAVSDEGVGIPTEDQQRIFEPFTRLSSNRHQPGQGLGLTIARQLVKAMGSDIQLRSEPGHGSCFWFDLSLEASADESVSDSQRIQLAMDLPPSEALQPLGRMVALGEVVEMRRWINAFGKVHPEWMEYMSALERCCLEVDLAGLTRLLALAGVTIGDATEGSASSC